MRLLAVKLVLERLLFLVQNGLPLLRALKVGLPRYKILPHAQTEKTSWSTTAFVKARWKERERKNLVCETRAQLLLEKIARAKVLFPRVLQHAYAQDITKNGCV